MAEQATLHCPVVCIARYPPESCPKYTILLRINYSALSSTGYNYTFSGRINSCALSSMEYNYTGLCLHCLHLIVSRNSCFLFTLFAIRIINNVTVFGLLGAISSRYRRRLLSRKCQNRIFFGHLHIYIRGVPLHFFLWRVLTFGNSCLHLCRADGNTPTAANNK